MKSQTFPIAIILLASLSYSVASANIFNEDKDKSLSGLRGRARKHKQILARKKSKQKGGTGQAGGNKNPAKKKQGRNKQKKKSKSKSDKKKPANNKNKPRDEGRNKPTKKDKLDKKEKLNKKNKPGKKDKPKARPDERIIGGSQATPNANKFVVSLQDKIGHFCGGSLITRNAVLSAAHCKGTPYDVVLGRHNVNSNQGQEIRAKRELPHPNYRSSTTDNDFMIVFLDQPATLNNQVGLISLNKDSKSPSVGNGVTVMGWGDTDIRDDVSTLSDVLMEVKVNVISNSECDASSGIIGGYPENYNGQISQNMLCAKANKQDGCQGDSGGPLVEGNTQVGVVSWGVGCAHKDFPGVYARVSKAYDWIQREVCNDNKEYAEEAGFDCSGASGPSPSPPSPSPPSGGGGGGGGGINNWDDDWSSSSGGGSGGGNGDNWDDDWSGNNWDDDWSSSSGGGSGGGNGDNWDDDWSGNNWDDDWPSSSGGGGGGNGNKWDDDWSSNNWDDDWSGNNWDDDWPSSSGGGGGGNGNKWDDDWSSFSGGGNSNKWDDDWDNGNKWDDDWGSGNNWDDDWGSGNNWDDDWSSNKWDDDW